MKFSKKYSVKIPKNIKIIYYAQQNFLVVVGPLGRKTLNLKLKIFLTEPANYIYITTIPTQKVSDNRKKTLKALCGTTVAIIRQCILETSVLLNKKIKLVGVGYKVFPKNYKSNQLLELKLGFSHFIYYKIPKTVQITPFKSTFIYIFSNSYYSLTQIAANIRSYKSPEPYKGKGVLYENEKIILKEGKKV